MSTPATDPAAPTPSTADQVQSLRDGLAALAASHEVVSAQLDDLEAWAVGWAARLTDITGDPAFRAALPPPLLDRLAASETRAAMYDGAPAVPDPPPEPLTDAVQAARLRHARAMWLARDDRTTRVLQALFSAPTVPASPPSPPPPVPAVTIPTTTELLGAEQTEPSPAYPRPGDVVLYAGDGKRYMVRSVSHLSEGGRLWVRVAPLDPPADPDDGMIGPAGAWLPLHRVKVVPPLPTADALCPACDGAGTRPGFRDDRQMMDMCPQCGGTGHVPTLDCPACAGTGRAPHPTVRALSPHLGSVPCVRCRATGRVILLPYQHAGQFVP